MTKPTKRKSIRVEISFELHKKLAMKAVVTGVPTTQVVREKLTAYVETEHPIVLLPEEEN